MIAFGTFFSLASLPWSRRWLSIISLSVVAQLAEAQITQTRRLEIPLNDGIVDQFEISHSGEEGLYLTRSVPAGLQVVKYDTAFAEQWSGVLPIPPQYNIVARKRFEGDLYFLCRVANFSKKNDLLLYAVNDESGIYSVYNIRSYIPFVPTEFQVTKSAVLIGGYFNQIPIAIHYDLKVFKSKVLPGLFNEAGEMNQIRTYPDGTFDVLIMAKDLQGHYTIFIKSYDADGNLIVNSPLITEPDTHLLFAHSLKAGEEKQIVAGVFGTRNKLYSRGLFISSIDPSGSQTTRYYHYGDLKNFFKYMKAGREKRVKERIERKKVKGKRARFNYRFLVHELIQHNGQYILLGEAFYPRYKNIERTGYEGFFSGGGLNQPIHNGRIFDGYFYTHAVVIAFDEDGKLLWDNSFEINDVRTFQLEQFVKLRVMDDRIALLYQYQNEIRTKIIKGDQVLEGKTSDLLTTFRPNEIVRKDGSDQGKLEYWYDAYMYASGTQEVISKTNRDLTRTVFYINKLKVGKD
jgi:hypothetical protein